MEITTRYKLKGFEILARAGFARIAWEYLGKIDGWYMFRNINTRQVIDLADNTTLIQKGLNEKGGRI
tara:strand:+ start:135 stop:335 length:201 start_codon:yes stop_codon:yes gene_type:complete